MDRAVTAIHTEFTESSAVPSVSELPMSHLSLEVGHLYMDDIARGYDRLVELAHEVAPWARTAREACARSVAPKTARISTCYLVDDYFSELGSPREIVPMMVAAAADAGVTIDYLARESACAIAGPLPLAALVLDHLVADPPPGTDGSRPVPHESGWLCNGVRSPGQGVGEAMAPKPQWRPPAENGANRHSIFVDVQLWDERPGGRRWSCPFLAAVWQLVRLGVLRNYGQPVVEVVSWDGSLPDSWRELPPVLRLRKEANPFTAYRTFSVLGSRFLPIEHAVRTVLSQVAVPDVVDKLLHERARGEKVTLPAEIVNRVGYAFVGG
jgi:hypothetical protein